MVTKFRCKKCNYEFYPREKDKTAPPGRCPYCGETNCVSVKKHILEEI